MSPRQVHTELYIKGDKPAGVSSSPDSSTFNNAASLASYPRAPPGSPPFSFDVVPGGGEVLEDDDSFFMA